MSLPVWTRRSSFAAAALLALAGSAASGPAPAPAPSSAPALAPAPSYDPARVVAAEPEILDVTARDEQRHRDLPLRFYLPAATQPAPVILFSHGLGGSREGSSFLGRHWARRGYVAVFLQHPGSDEAVWKSNPAEARAALGKAMNVENYLLRARDVPAVIDQLERWNAAAGHKLQGRLDLSRLGMSGHSFGAMTTQAVSGQRTSSGFNFTDPRIKAALVLSPSRPRRESPAEAFGKVTLPWLLMTGTRDASPVGEATAAARLEVFAALPPGGKYLLVLDGAEHSVFTDRALPHDQAQRNPRHHPAIEALSTAFFDAFLNRDPAARAWLDGAGPRSVLAPEDRWESK